MTDRRLTLALAVLVFCALPLTLSAAPPELGAADRAAIRAVYARAAALNPQLLAKTSEAVARVRDEYRRGCEAKYENESEPHQQVVAVSLALMAKIRLARIAYPLWSSFARPAQRSKVSNQLLRRARSALAIERRELPLLAKVKFGVCSGLADIASGAYNAEPFSQDAAWQWDSYTRSSAGFDQVALYNTDVSVRESRPALLAAGLASAQAKLVIEWESARVVGGLSP